jgi:hypothetical protein
MNTTPFKILRPWLWGLSACLLIPPLCAALLESNFGCSLGPKLVLPCYVGSFDIAPFAGVAAWLSGFAFLPVFFIAVVVTVIAER